MNKEASLGSKKKHVLLLAYQSLGIVYGDLIISPLYVYDNAFSGSLHHHQTEEVIFGVLSLIFWSLTVFSLFKYVVIILSANDNGEGGTLALYSILRRHAKFNLLPNHQAADEELQAYHRPGYVTRSTRFRIFLEKHKHYRTCLLLIVLFAACMVISDGVFSPALSVLSSFQGLKVHNKSLNHGNMATIVCMVLVGLFALQHRGTHKVSFMFAPVVIVWLLSIAALGIYNILKWNHGVYRALSPYYIYKFFKQTQKVGWSSIGGLLLCITGSEAMFVDLGHFSTASIRIAFSCLVYPCLVLQYMGQAAFLSKNFSVVTSSFYNSIPDPFFWPMFVLAILAAFTASQAVISMTFSIVKQCQALGCFPRVKVVHTTRWIRGQVYIPELNWILMILSMAVAIGFQDTTLIGNAYGLAFMSTTLVNTWLLSLVIIFVWSHNIVTALLPLLLFTPIELIYLSSYFVKLSKGGLAQLVFTTLFMFVMYVWNYGSRRKYLLEVQNKVPMKWILGLGPSLGVVRVPGISLIYTELVSGVPAIFTQFLTNLPAINQTVVFVCIKSIPVPHVSDRDRYLVGRVGPKSYRMYRCIIRYGYQDVDKYVDDFEDNLVMSITEFIRMEAEGCRTSDELIDARMAVVRTSGKFGTRLVTSDSSSANKGITSRYKRSCSMGKSSTLHSLHNKYEVEESPEFSQRHTRFQLPGDEYLEEELKEELIELLEAKEAGIAYIVGHSFIRARRHSSKLKRFVINRAFSFLRKNCRSSAVVLHIPHISLIQVGVVYYI
ncbi:potassium transporter 7 isoform X2 [Beta vulgaris subsp. vulgaris]|uniref:potassium transporter 7 isoform X2 n=1 Tax=Beta vulgaris subsp. vulgaris TaxID=3555 RepID=UPI0020373AC6|nr:potassium transporter 7 isoform X2 [Beta vulgaris subsp. vulgaris]